ncbi:MAG: transposase [Pseudomonadota bacterium]
MARQPRTCIPGLPHHLIQRGNNRQLCFVSDADFAAYARWLAEGADQYEVALHGWVFMDNHVHLVGTPEHADSLSRLMQYVGRQYVRYFNDTHERTGTLYEGRFRSCVVQDDVYLLNCLRYVELNPVRAGMVDDPGDFHWSSYKAHAFGLRMAMWTPHPTYVALSEKPAARQRQYRRLFEQAPDTGLEDRIRRCVKAGLALGSEAFCEQIANQRGQSYWVYSDSDPDSDPRL